MRLLALLITAAAPLPILADPPQDDAVKKELQKLAFGPRLRLVDGQRLRRTGGVPGFLSFLFSEKRRYLAI
jgi:hypothetical protein